MSLCDRIEDYLNRQLDSAVAAEMEKHIESCAACAQRVAGWRRVEQRLHDWVDARTPVLPDTARSQRLLARVRTKKDAPRPPRLVWAAVAATVLVVVAILAVRSQLVQPPDRVAVAEPVAPLEVLDPGGIDLQLAPDYRGQTLAASPQHRLLVRVSRNTVALARASRATFVEATAARTRLKVLSGEVAIDHPPGGHELVVDAGGLSVSVTGTRFSVAHREDRTVTVSVARGSVTVSGRGLARQTVAAGHALTIDTHQSHRQTTVDPEKTAQIEQWLSSVPTTEPDLAPDPPTRPDKTRPPEKRPSRSLNAWQQRILAGEWSEVAREVTDYLATAPRDAEAWWVLADAYRKGSRWREAARACEKVIRFGQPSAANQARFLAATVWQDRLDSPTQALELLVEYRRQPTRLQPLEAAAMVRQARCLLATGQVPAAERVFRELVAKHPDSVQAREGRAYLEGKP